MTYVSHRSTNFWHVLAMRLLKSWLFLRKMFHPQSKIVLCNATFREWFSSLSKIPVYKINKQIYIILTRKNCNPPDFSKATVAFFLTSPWLQRIQSALDLLENLDPRVQSCMTKYFGGKIQQKIQQCVRQYGDREVQNFEMPPLPDWRGLDIGKLYVSFCICMQSSKNYFSILSET